jgi:hypothetical protein
VYLEVEIAFETALADPPAHFSGGEV